MDINERGRKLGLWWHRRFLWPRTLKFLRIQCRKVWNVHTRKCTSRFWIWQPIWPGYANVRVLLQRDWLAHSIMHCTRYIIGLVQLFYVNIASQLCLHRMLHCIAADMAVHCIGPVSGSDIAVVAALQLPVSCNCSGADCGQAVQIYFELSWIHIATNMHGIHATPWCVASIHRRCTLL